MGINLRNYQKTAIDYMIKHKRCLLISPTGSGKSCIIIGLTEIKNCKTLVIVPTTQLVIQTIEKFEQFLKVSPLKFDNKKRDLAQITITTWQSMALSIQDGFIPNVDMIIADECHALGEDTNYFDIVKKVNPSLFYAVTATPYRYDDIKPLENLCFNNRYEIDIQDLYNLGFLIKPEISFITTGFRYNIEETLTPWEKGNLEPEMLVGKLKSLIGKDVKRNKFILNFIHKTVGKYSIVLSYTTDQTEFLYNNYQVPDLFTEKHLIHGKLSAKDKKAFFEIIEKPGNFIIFATQSFLGEGIDIPKLDTLFVTSPLGSKAKPIQFAGRILRPYEGKKTAKIYDFVDNISGIGNQWQYTRKNQYDKLKAVFTEGSIDTKKLNLMQEYNELIKRWDKAEKYFNETPNPAKMYITLAENISKRIAEISKIIGSPESPTEGYIL